MVGGSITKTNNSFPRYTDSLMVSHLAIQTSTTTMTVGNGVWPKKMSVEDRGGGHGTGVWSKKYVEGVSPIKIKHLQTFRLLVRPRPWCIKLHFGRR